MKINIKFYDLCRKYSVRLLILTLCFFIWQTAYAAPGDLDPTFSGDGKLTDFFPGFGNYYAAAAIQTDGKIVTVGQVDYGFTTACGISRFNADGSPDASFGAAGKVVRF